MSEPEVVPATAAHRERWSATVVAAFVADPAFRFFFPDDATYPELAARFAGYLFDKRLPPTAAPGSSTAARPSRSGTGPRTKRAEPVPPEPQSRRVLGLP